MCASLLKIRESLGSKRLDGAAVYLNLAVLSNNILYENNKQILAKGCLWTGCYLVKDKQLALS